MKKIVRLLVALLFGAVIFSYFFFDLGQHLSLENLQSQKSSFDSYYSSNPWQVIFIYFGVYVLMAAFSIPGALGITVVGGVLFGTLTGTIVVSFASTIGATLSFLSSRLILGEWVQSKFGASVKKMNRQIEKDGAFYLFALRLVPLFPFFLINLAMGLTKIKTASFFLVSQIGMLPGTIAFVYAGAAVGDRFTEIESLSGLVSVEVLIAFAILGLMPFVLKKFLMPVISSWHYYFKSKSPSAAYQKPKTWDYNFIAIGGGSAGLVSSYVGSAVNARVALIEKHKMGGDCLNTGCVPSKALIKTGKILHEIGRAKDFGIHSASAEFDFATVMERVQNVIKKIERHDSIERYTKLGVDVIQGEAKVLSPYEVEVNGKVLRTKNIILATGATPFVPPIPGLKEIGYQTSDTIWNLREKPNRLLVMGGGPIGSELTQAFHRLGIQVIQVERMDRIMAKEDPEVSNLIQKKFVAEGIDLRLNTNLVSFKKVDGKKMAVCESKGETLEIPFDEVLVAVGRKARVEGFGLEDLGVKVAPNGTLEVDPYLRATYRNIYACGDLVGPYQFTHMAAHQAWFCAVNSLFAPWVGFPVDYSVVPWATFVDPEVARVGMNEDEAKAADIDYQVSTYGLDDLDRAIADSETEGFVKVITAGKSDKILGVTIVGYHASDLLAEFVTAMKHGLGLNKILGTIHTYPTVAEANKYAAGVWKRANKPEKLLRYLRRFFFWRIGKTVDPQWEREADENKKAA